MVSDPRVTPLLNKLGGLYRDPTRVDRDASSLLKSSVGVHLHPGIASLVENNGQTSKCLVLQGTIAIFYRSVTYQLLVDMFLPPGYPMRPPVAYVRLANPNMYLKENHAHVGRDGMVYLPYLSEWKQHSHNLVEMVVAMSSVFSADPPVFTRTATNAPTPMTAHPVPTTAETRVQQVPTMASSLLSRFGAPTSNNNAATTSTASSSSSAAGNSYYAEESRRQAAAEELLAKEAEEANRAAEIARALEQQEQEQERLRARQQLYEQQQFEKIKAKAHKKLQEHLQQQITTSQRTLQDFWKDQHVLPQNQKVLGEQVKSLESRKAELEQHLATVHSQTKELELWLEQVRLQKKEEEESKMDVNDDNNNNIDDMVMGTSKLQDQILRLEAENSALGDVLYFMDRRMFHSQKDPNDSMDCATFLKQVRQLAKRQFIVRAHLLKIRSTLSACASF